MQVFFKNHIIMVFSNTSCSRLGMNSSSQRNVLECTVDGKNVIWYACLNQTPYLPLPAVVAHINNSTECGKQDISIRE